MKGVLLLALALSVYGSPLYLGSLYQGFSSSIAEVGACFRQPEECGRALGHVVGHLREHSSVLSGINWDYHDFFTGLLEGLQNPDESNSPCYSDFSQTINNLANLMDILIHMNLHDPNLLSVASMTCDGSSIFSYDYRADCNFDNLLDSLRSFTLKDGLARYVGNLCPANLAAVSVAQCLSDPLDCGFGVGTLIRIELDWSL